MTGHHKRFYLGGTNNVKRLKLPLVRPHSRISEDGGHAPLGKVFITLFFLSALKHDYKMVMFLF